MNTPSRILVVEDESIVAFNLQQRLIQMGYDVPAIAVSGQESIDLVAQTSPDLVLMDIHIQGDMDGIEVAAHLQNSHSVPVIYLTAYSEDSTLERARRTRPYGYLLKPFSERELHATIQMAFERHKLENELTDKQRLLEQALDAASMGVMELDCTSNQITPSFRTAELLGLALDHPLPLAEFISRVDEQDRTIIETRLQESVSDLKQFTEEFRVLTQGQEAQRWIRVDANQWPSAKMVGVVQDITLRKHNEIQLKLLNEGLEKLVNEKTIELRQSLKELETFSYSAAHDLRAPVQAILGLSQELLREPPPELASGGLGLVQRIAKAAQRMGTLIDALLHMARLNQMPMQLRPVNISEIATEVAAQLLESNPTRVAQIQISPNMEAMGDPTLVGSVIDNLMRNAWKFSARTGVTRIDVSSKTIRGETVFFVRDNGCGFDMATAGRLFGPFQRLHREEDYAGTGIGLTIVQRIVMRHGGRVWASAEPGQGAAFHFTLSP